MNPMMTPTRLLSAMTTRSQGEGRKGAICRMISGMIDGSQVVTALVATWENPFKQISNASSPKHSLVINTVLPRSLIQ